MPQDQRRLVRGMSITAKTPKSPVELELEKETEQAMKCLVAGQESDPVLKRKYEFVTSVLDAIHLEEKLRGEEFSLDEQLQLGREFCQLLLTTDGLGVAS